MRRTLALAALAALCLAALPALAATTDQEKYEKKVRRFVVPATAELDFTKPRGLCTCVSDDSLIRGRIGMLIYAVQNEGMAGNTVKAGCQVPLFDASGAQIGDGSCENWELLSH
jgi:hypothetical protein